MFYKYFIVTPDYKVQEQTADDMEVVKDHAQIVCGTNDKLEYEDYTVYFNNTKVESANFAVGNIGAYGTLVFCIGKDSDDVRMITQHFKNLESDEEYKGLFSKETASGITTLEVFSDVLLIVIGKNPVIKEPCKKDNELKLPRLRKSFEECKLEAFNNIALLIRKWLIEHDMLNGSFIIFGGKGYIRHGWSKDDNSLSYYEQKSSEDTPKEFDLIVTLSKEAAEFVDDDIFKIDGLGTKLMIEDMWAEQFNHTTWVLYYIHHDEF
ncbi:hypothetical protein [Anaerotruncus colihominis]|uniref:Uncharacterized protein n=1 Tax=Anaerotruncus colihominis DSM 17241 TaxID=445972 RepID=B0PE63_9FIRM|nr:hypothetical protein [Anaerotruncus colihominis]EDS10252.1 hypothetical protein ANACOL_02848 [Anaerotruncus colihominis DSM 17241]UWN76376.1 hypothetical protein NQ528_07410 [Anaerotruncus colihominis]